MPMREIGHFISQRLTSKDMLRHKCDTLRGRVDEITILYLQSKEPAKGLAGLWLMQTDERDSRIDDG